MFKRPEPRATFTDFIRALLSNAPKKNSWGLADQAQHATPKAFEHLLDGAVWDADQLRDEIRDYVVTNLGTPNGVLVLDDTQVIKKGTKSVGVAPQHCGSTGQTENCQAMVMLTYASRHGHAFIDRELYLPACWTGAPDRCTAAGVPDNRAFTTKPELAVVMLARAVRAGIPAAWVAADSGYGRDPQLRAYCHGQGLPYVMASSVDVPLVGPGGQALRPDTAVAAADPVVFERRSAGPGAKGDRYYDWAALTATVKNQRPAPGYAHTLLVRRSTEPKVTKKHPEGILEIEYFLVHAPKQTPIPEMITVAGTRWNIEDDNRAGKDLVGLGDYQVRKWTPWYRHVTCAMLAHAMLAVTRANLGKDQPPIRDEAAA